VRIERHYTKKTKSAYAGIEFRETTSEIKNPDGTVVFRLENIQVPGQFSQVASDILAQKYFRKAGVPARPKKVEENNVPSFLWRSVADEKALAKLQEDERYGSESDARQVLTALPALGLIGVGKVAISTARKMPRLFMMNCASCSQPNAARQTARNGSTPVCTGPMASTDQARDIIMWIIKPAN